MTELLKVILKMSFSASCMIPLVLIIRWLMKRLPKKFSYALWFLVLFRFLCPWQIPSPLNLLPVSSPELQRIIQSEIAEPVSGLLGFVQEVNQSMEYNLVEVPGPVESSHQNIVSWLCLVWINGMIILTLSGLFRFLRLKQRLAAGVRVEDGIYESDRINEAFMIGIFRPVIYLPTGLDEVCRKYVVCHERAHIFRFDSLAKLIGFIMVRIHWFNPFAWLSYHLMCRDMEMSCDERVLKTLGMEAKKAYSLALLQAAESRSGLLVLAFGESSTKLRIRNILNYRKPRFWMSLVAGGVLLCAGIVLVTDITGPVIETPAAISIIGGADGPTSIFLAGKSEDGNEPFTDTKDMTISELVNIEWIAEAQFNPYPHPASAETVTNDGIYLDMATRNSVVFHGDFGMFSFEQIDGVWQPLFYVQGNDAKDFADMFDQLSGTTDIWSSESIHKEERLMSSELANGAATDNENGRWLDFDARKMADGSIAVLGGYANEQTAQLIDLFYGYYDPEEQIFNQVYLFMGDGVMTVNDKGEIDRQRYSQEAFN